MVETIRVCGCSKMLRSRACSYKRSGILSRLGGMVLERECSWNDYDMVLDRDDFWCSCVELCDI
jgi:hypothetical protein